MKLTWWQAVIIILAFWLAFLNGFARADVIDDVQEVVIVLDTLATDLHDNTIQEDFWQFMPVDDFKVYVKTWEVGVKWSF